MNIGWRGSLVGGPVKLGAEPNYRIPTKHGPHSLQVCLCFDEATGNRLIEAADRTGMTRAQVVRNALERHFNLICKPLPKAHLQASSGSGRPPKDPQTVTIIIPAEWRALVITEATATHPKARAPLSVLLNHALSAALEWQDLGTVEPKPKSRRKRPSRAQPRQAGKKVKTVDPNVQADFFARREIESRPGGGR